VRNWIGLIVSLVLADAGVLWLLQSDGPAGVEVRRYGHSHGEFGQAIRDILRVGRPPEMHSDKAFSEAIFGVALSPDDRLALSAEPDAIPLWRKRRKSELRRFPAHLVSASGEALSTSWKLDSRPDLALRLWDLPDGREIRRFEAKEHERVILCFVISPDGRQVFAGSGDGTLRLWELGTGKEVWHFDGPQFDGPQGAILGVAFSPDGRRVLSACRDKTIRFWDVASGQERGRYDLHVPGIASAAFSADGLRALTGGVDGSVRLWDLGSGQELCRCQGHRSWVTSVSFSPDGRRAVSGSWDRTVRLWDLENGRQVCVCRGHADVVHGVSFSPDGDRALSGGCDGTVRVWQLPAP
jgi:WD40 repeat protein